MMWGGKIIADLFFGSRVSLITMPRNKEGALGGVLAAAGVKMRAHACRKRRRRVAQLQRLGVMSAIATLILVVLSYGQMALAGNPDAKRLYDDLLSNYNKLVRPVVNVSEPVTVRLKLKLSQLIDVVRSSLVTMNIIMFPKLGFTIEHVDLA